MSKKLYIHIGKPKTGTSFAQSVLYANQNLLKAQNVCYLPYGFRKKDYSVPSHHNFAHDLLNHPDLNVNGDRLKDLPDLVRNTEQDTCLLSCEAFCEADDKQVKNLKKLLDGIDTKIVIVLRNQVDQIQSEFGCRHWQLYKCSPDQEVELLLKGCLDRFFILT